MRFVTLYNLDTKRRQQIPICELSPKMVPIKLADDGAIVWADPGKLKLRTKPLHPPFSADKLKLLKQLNKALIEVFPRTVKEWEDGFRRDQNPDREIRLWQWIAFHYLRLTGSGTPSRARKMDCFRLCLNWVNIKDTQAVIETTPLTEITREEAAHFLDEFKRVPSKFLGGSFAAMPDAFAFYSALRTLEEFKQIAAASTVIFAVDWNTGDLECVYGRETTGEHAENEEACDAVFFAVDFNTQRLEHLLAAVQVTKGWAEWRGQMLSSERE